MRISVDVGFGYTKAISEYGNIASFPSVVAQRMNMGGMLIDNVIGKGQTDDYIVSIWPPGKPDEYQEYFLGDAGLVNAGVRKWEENIRQNNNLPVLITTACALVGNGQPVDLAVGLPMAYFSQQKETLWQVLKGLSYCISIPHVVEKAKVEIQSVRIYPQGSGVYYSCLLTKDGQLKNAELAGNPVGIVDIGYRTTDIMVMAKGKKGVAPAEGLSGGLEAGMNTAWKQIQQAASEMTGQNIIEHWVEQALIWNDGSLEIRGKKYSLIETEAKAYRYLAEQIVARVKQLWGPEINRLSTILIAGGGGENLHPYLDEMFNHNLVKAENPAFANAEGYLAAQALEWRRAGA